ncbi:MAG: triacylglycerol lipase [Gammaproteobacteria bacterium]|nr:triacylglycerol lipase [Gammaproteobacteria bacterium]
MKRSALVLVGSLLASSLASATTATYQFCSTSGCKAAGSATVTSTYAKTKYPLVMAHGMGGFTAIGGLTIGQYFYGINADLTSNGATVFATQVASFDSSYVRGEQLRSQVNQILAITGAQKVNLIGHSQGVLDSRYVAATMPNNVASVTGVAGPNLGSPVADTVKSVTQVPVLGGLLTPVISGGMNAFFSLLDLSSGQQYSQSSLAGLNQLTSSGMASYNAQFPQGMPTTKCGQGAASVNGIKYYSWGGTGVFTNPLNPADYFLGLTSVLIPGASDGLVGQCSSHLGTVIRDNYFQNHLDEVNLFLGLVSPLEASPVTLFRNQANRLKNVGL